MVLPSKISRNFKCLLLTIILQQLLKKLKKILIHHINISLISEKYRNQYSFILNSTNKSETQNIISSLDSSKSV